MEKPSSKKIYIMMNKPCGYVCSAVSDSHQTVYELLPGPLRSLAQNAKRGKRLHTVGRLDCNTSGLLLFTTDGDFSNYLTRPQNHIPKTYEAVIKTPVEEPAQAEYISRASKGVMLPAEKKAPEQQSAGAQLEFITPTFCRITLTEGKFHEVRRLFQALGNEVVELKRLSFGNYKLPQDLNPGEFRAIEKVL
jgi:16S rRNA pseudouridine516 synthase